MRKVAAVLGVLVASVGLLAGCGSSKPKAASIGSVVKYLDVDMSVVAQGVGGETREIPLPAIDPGAKGRAITFAFGCAGANKDGWHMAVKGAIDISAPGCGVASDSVDYPSSMPARQVQVTVTVGRGVRWVLADAVGQVSPGPTT